MTPLCSLPPAEPAVGPVEGPRPEQGEQILQRQPLFGSVGSGRQPPRPVKPPGASLCCVCILGKLHKACVTVCVGLVWKALPAPPTFTRGATGEVEEGGASKNEEGKRSNEFARSG